MLCTKGLSRLVLRSEHAFEKGRVRELVSLIIAATRMWKCDIDYSAHMDLSKLGSEEVRSIPSEHVVTDIQAVTVAQAPCFFPRAVTELLSPRPRFHRDEAVMECFPACRSPLAGTKTFPSITGSQVYFSHSPREL